jgi:hypothetical protein
MFNNASSFNRTSPSVFGNSGRPVSGMPGMGLGQNLSAAATAGKQNPNLAAKITPPKAVPATATGVQAMTQPTKTAALLFMLKSAQGGAPVPGPAGMPPTPGTPTVVPPAPPGPTPPPPPGPTPIPMNLRRQPLRARTQSDDRQQSVLAGLVSDGERARAMPDKAPIAELESDLMTRGKIGSDSISAFSKFAALYKKSKQDNSKPSRSGMGEQNGLTYAQRKEDHATGADAWASLDRFKHKKANDALLANTFVDTCASNGMNLDQIANAVIKVGNDFDQSIFVELMQGIKKIAADTPISQVIKNYGSGLVEGAKNLLSQNKGITGKTVILGGLGAAGGANNAARFYENEKDSPWYIPKILAHATMGGTASAITPVAREHSSVTKQRMLPPNVPSTTPAAPPLNMFQRQPTPKPQEQHMPELGMVQKTQALPKGQNAGQTTIEGLATGLAFGGRGQAIGTGIDTGVAQLVGEQTDKDGKPLPPKTTFARLGRDLGFGGGLFKAFGYNRFYDVPKPTSVGPLPMTAAGAGLGFTEAMTDLTPILSGQLPKYRSQVADDLIQLPADVLTSTGSRAIPQIAERTVPGLGNIFLPTKPQSITIAHKDGPPESISQDLFTKWYAPKIKDEKTNLFYYAWDKDKTQPISEEEKAVFKKLNDAQKNKILEVRGGYPASPGYKIDEERFKALIGPKLRQLTEPAAAAALANVLKKINNDGRGIDLIDPETGNLSEFKVQKYVQDILDKNANRQVGRLADATREGNVPIFDDKGKPSRERIVALAKQLAAAGVDEQTDRLRKSFQEGGLGEVFESGTKRPSREGIGKVLKRYGIDVSSNVLNTAHNYINSYTDPIYEAMGIDPKQLALWQRYGMLGAAGLGGVGLLTGSPYMMGAGALGLGAGLYPHFGGMANPWLQRQYGLSLPRTNVYTGQLPPTPPPPSR